jgi:hypothetical protein
MHHKVKCINMQVIFHVLYFTVRAETSRYACLSLTLCDSQCTTSYVPLGGVAALLQGCAAWCGVLQHQAHKLSMPVNKDSHSEAFHVLFHSTAQSLHGLRHIQVRPPSQQNALHVQEMRFGLHAVFWRRLPPGLELGSS